MKILLFCALAVLLCAAVWAGPLVYKEGALKTNLEKGEKVSMETIADSRYKYAVVPCKPGDWFTIDANGGSIYLAWAFTDSEYRLLDKGGVQTRVQVQINAPAKASYMITNDKGGYLSFKGKLTVKDMGTGTFCLENPAVAGFLANTEYNTGDYSYSLVENYRVSAGERLDQPLGATVNIPRVSGSRGYVLTYADNPAYADKKEAKADKKAKVFTIYNLIPGRVYWYEIASVQKDGRQPLCKGIIRTTGVLRMIKADSIHNVRDIGGWKTCDGRTIRYGLIFRGGQMDRGSDVTPEDAAELTENLGIRADIDFRGAEELLLDDDDPSNDLDHAHLGGDVLYTNIPIGGIDPDGGGRELYIRVFRQLLSNLKEKRPTYLHCAGGADRTGCFFMFLEGLLGVKENDLMKDVELTSFSVYGTRQRTMDHYKLALEAARKAPGDTFRDKWINYALAGGLTREEIDEFAAIMLD
ncbi:MAG: tyrosine-protein phosphatase [Abditibacteriota bacterium]|nr:tyrosine-protein phosphatase [Abditibacteriota bacterium]